MSVMLKYWARLYGNMTAPEKTLESEIAAMGERYRCQHPFWGLSHFADFVLLDRMVIIEVDGDSHNTPRQKEKDLKHTMALKGLGWAVIRVRNELVMSSPRRALREALITEQAVRQVSIESLQADLDRLHRDHPELLLPKAKRPKREPKPRAAASRPAGRK